MEPYRDELEALRAENARLRAQLAPPKRGRATIRPLLLSLLAIQVATIGAFWLLTPLLNAPSDGRFALGLALAVALVAIDALTLRTLLRRPFR